MTGVSQPSGLLAARQRAAALAGARDLAGAQAVLEHAAEVGKGLLGEDDPGVLGALHQLARVHQEAGDPMAARRVLEEAYAAGRWRLGDSDPLMLEISYDLGIVAEELGNRHEARRAFGRVATLGAEVLGPEHWAVTQARAYLGDEPAVPEGPLTVETGTATTSTYGNGPIGPAPRTAPALEEPTAVQPAILPRRAEPDVAAAAPTPPAIVTRPQLPVQARRGPEMPAEVIRDVPARTRAPAALVPAMLVPAAPDRSYRRRGAAVYAAIAASLAAVIAVIALVVVLANRHSGDDKTSPNVPTLGGPAPSGVELADKPGTITVTWTDPALGKTTFVVEMARPGEVMKAVGHVGPGQTSFRMDGLNDKLDYCFTVVAVYSTTRFSPSSQACTSRETPH